MESIDANLTVPDVTVVREAVADVTKLALLDVLLDRVHGLVLGNLQSHEVRDHPRRIASRSEIALVTNLELGIRPTRDWNGD